MLKHFITTLLFAIIALIVHPSSADAQRNALLKEEGQYLGFSGEFSAPFSLKDSNAVRDGKFRFTSDLKKEVQNDNFFIQSLNVEGSYSGGVPTQNWKYTFSTYILDELAISPRNRVDAAFKLNGKEEQWSLPYTEGRISGEATLKKRDISQGRYSRLSPIATLSFDNDTLAGSFSYTDDTVRIVGKTNSRGFLDGTLTMEYPADTGSIIEERKYKDGFLFNLTKIKKGSKDTLLSLDLSDVSDRYNALLKNGKDLQYKISDEWFGVKFNLGFDETSRKIREQKRGNEKLMEFFHFFTPLYTGSTGKDSSSIILKLTRRFEFLYLEDEERLLDTLLPHVQALTLEMEEFLERPALQIRKASSDEVLRNFHIIKHTLQKFEQVTNILCLIQDGYFKYRLRDLYYKNGVPFLRSSDTISYTFDGKERKLHYNPENLLLKSDSLVHRLQKLSEEFEGFYAASRDTIINLLTIYDNQDLIDAIDGQIVVLKAELDEKFISPDSAGEVDSLGFSDKVFMSIFERHISPRKEKYIKNSLSQKETIELGKSIVCFQEFLVKNKFYFDSIETFSANWKDSLFAEYKDNPFDYRKIARPVLGGVSQAAHILLREYATSLLNAEDCKELEESLGKIKKLSRRVEFLVENKTNDNVIKLDRTLSRERVAKRIERILEI